LFSFGLGFAVGVDTTINKAVKLIPYFTNISIDENAIHDALFKYNSQVSSCYGIKT